MKTATSQTGPYRLVPLSEEQSQLRSRRYEKELMAGARSKRNRMLAWIGLGVNEFFADPGRRELRRSNQRPRRGQSVRRVKDFR